MPFAVGGGRLPGFPLPAAQRVSTTEISLRSPACPTTEAEAPTTQLRAREERRGLTSWRGVQDEALVRHAHRLGAHVHLVEFVGLDLHPPGIPPAVTLGHHERGGEPIKPTP